ncbi:MAG: metalloprotease family protein [Caldilinea sp.]|nr:metalloprotease family protein [Caldilinea sp.]MCW5842555.1 DUF3267 domain-containing protein [Caldilinea sp.]
MIIPGFLISLVTFPGVIVHELAHVVFCRLTKTPILNVCYFRLGNPAGYVIHERPSSVWRHILIATGPFFVNSLLGIVLGLALQSMRLDLDNPTTGTALLLWLAVSIAMHSFPSTGDARSVARAVRSAEAPITARLVGWPLIAIIFLGALGSVFWLDIIYGFAVVIVIPEFVFGSS